MTAAGDAYAILAARYARHRPYRAADPRPADPGELRWWKSDTYVEHYGGGLARARGRTLAQTLAEPPPLPLRGPVNPLLGAGSRYARRFPLVMHGPW